MEMPVGTPKEDLKSTLRASVFLIRRAIRDIVTPVSPMFPSAAPVSADEMLDIPQEATVAQEVAWSLASSSARTARKQGCSKNRGQGGGREVCLCSGILSGPEQQ